MNKILPFLLLVSMCTIASAQEIKVGGYAGIFGNFGNFKDYFDPGYGFDLDLSYVDNETYVFGVDVSYHRFDMISDKYYENLVGDHDMILNTQNLTVMQMLFKFEYFINPLDFDYPFSPYLGVAVGPVLPMVGGDYVYMTARLVDDFGNPIPGAADLYSPEDLEPKELTNSEINHGLGLAGSFRLGFRYLFSESFSAETRFTFNFFEMKNYYNPPTVSTEVGRDTYFYYGAQVGINYYFRI